MRYLLDTHTFLWWIVDDPQLSSKVKALLRDAQNEIFFSAASAWEISIKAQLGRIMVHGDPADIIPQQIADNGFATLPISVRHALHVFKLASIRCDPFESNAHRSGPTPRSAAVNR